MARLTCVEEIPWCVRWTAVPASLRITNCVSFLFGSRQTITFWSANFGMWFDPSRYIWMWCGVSNCTYWNISSAVANSRGMMCILYSDVEQSASIMEHLYGPCVYRLSTGSGSAPCLISCFADAIEIQVETTAGLIAAWTNVTAASITAKCPRWIGANRP
eukprot:4542323-Amphidinium_carterae.2